MNIVVVGLNHRTAPVEIRERLAMPDVARALLRLKADPAIEEGMILSTCNRVEIYAVVSESSAGFAALQRFLLETAGALPPAELLPCLYFHSAGDTLRHLFRVASGLDSMVIGEPQILGQVKEAFDAALLHKTTGVILNKVMKKTLSVAKRVRTETDIADHAVSIGHAAVELAKKIFGNLNHHSAFLIGAGEIAELAARHFVAHHVESLAITNRSYERAVALAQALGGVPVPFDGLVAQMIASDIVLCSTGAPDYLVGLPEVEKAIAARQNRPIFFIDVSVPRNIDPAINRIDNVFLYDIDDLKLSSAASLRLRETAALKAEVIIEEEALAFSRWFKSLDAVPMIVALKERAEAIRKAEIDRALEKIGPLTPDQKEAMNTLTAGIVNKLLHNPLTVMKEEAASANGTMVLEAARRLFHLDSAPETSVAPDPSHAP